MKRDIIKKDGFFYSISQRQFIYNPELHENHNKPYTVSDLAYICSVWDSKKKNDIALAMGRTNASLRMKVQFLRKEGLFEHYKQLGAVENESRLH